jgi:exo-poly-alpha-galacturonosidase
MKKIVPYLIISFIFSFSYVNAQQKTDVWDFGEAQLDNAIYTNKLAVGDINKWYTYSATLISGTANSTYNVLPTTCTSGILKWVGGSNDRLRTSNTTLTRYDTNLGGVGTSGCTGRIYVNSAATSGRYIELTLNADDEITIVEASDAAGMLNFEYMDVAAVQKNQSATSTTAAEYKFVAKNQGKYRIYDSTSKPSYYRIYRKPAIYTTITGNVDETTAPGISGYSVVFTNPAGKSWTALVTSGAYSVTIPVGYTYKMSLLNANGYIISNGDSLNVTDTTTNYTISVLKVNLFTVSGTITGLGTDISKATLVYTPNPVANKIYVPKPVINTVNSTYSVDLESNTQYTITGTGVNDYEILSNTITVTAATTATIDFTPKIKYGVTFNTTGLNMTQLSNLTLIFTNLNESGYVYTFAPSASIALRNGTYAVSYSGLDNYPVDLGLVSNLKVNGAAVSKILDFKPVTVWSFDDKTVSTTTLAGYKGMLVTGIVSNRLAQGDLTAKTGATIKIPVTVGDKVSISYYYAANFSIESGAPISTTSGSTSLLENTEYTYTGVGVANPGYVTITLLGTALTSYFTNIQIGGSSAYKPIITVGTAKDYQTINAALIAVSNMVRTATDRVTIMIDPGNYEEMVEITQPNITLKNAAVSPNINLLNKGVDIDAGAVRITSYYGIGYNYYSMKSNQKWDADVLRVNKENGYQTYTNVSGTTNNSFWNATLLVGANGFTAENIIIENSYNQYISLKESQDVVELASGNKGIRPTTYGSVAVQDKAFVERAAAIAVKNNVDKVILNQCRVVGRQDSFFGGSNARVVVYKGVMMGSTDYLFGGMNAVFYKTDLAMNTSNSSSDASYITAAQQATGRGYLMYECKVTTAIPGTETASTYRSKPGYFGRPWAASTSEVVFYNTTIETSNYPGFEGQSLIMPIGWNNSLSGESAKMYEYGTVEKSGVDNILSRAAWATKLTQPTLTDATPITTLNFTKGPDNWDPISQLIANDTSLATKSFEANVTANVYAFKNNVIVNNVKSNTAISIYGLNGVLVKSLETKLDTMFTMPTGIWVVTVKDNQGQNTVKIITH